jgi:hypothetical protein
MKIKTTEQIILEESYLTEKWVSVENEILHLQQLIENGEKDRLDNTIWRISEDELNDRWIQRLEKLIKQLKGN